MKNTSTARPQGLVDLQRNPIGKEILIRVLESFDTKSIQFGAWPLVVQKKMPNARKAFTEEKRDKP